MSIDAMKQALEALDIVQIHFTQNRHVNDAIAALILAIEQAEKQEPVDGVRPCPFCGDSNLGFEDGSTYRWGVAYCAGCGASAGETRREYPDKGKWHEEAIKQWNTRVAPPQRQPLTEKEVSSAWNSSVRIASVEGNAIKHFARAIERKHGIGGEHE
jgi:Restriction alleviation protein Lar